ncbi:hypothetical protein DFR86_03430 [Acidianus sulfidivorans JP7]|nr:hypothetical protein [Acidianus sulfidivorans]AWR96700.2 hypothetical protein DFR86_03430 [Acidianus sulfidivorans JP7]
MKKKLAAGLVILYAVSLAIFLPTVFQANPNDLITNIINPFGGGNFLWGRESGIIESNVPISEINLTYIVPVNITLHLKVINDYISNTTIHAYYNASPESEYQELVKEYGIVLPIPGQIINVTSQFKAVTNESTINSTLPPYETNITRNVYYEMFNTTPPTPFYYAYQTSDTITQYVPSSGTYANDSGVFSEIPFAAHHLPFNSTIILNITTQPILPGVKESELPNISFIVNLTANHYVSLKEYVTTASFYINTVFINSLQATTTQLPGVSTATSPVLAHFNVPGGNYMVLVDLGLWSNITTVYVRGISPVTYNNGSFHAVVIPPAMIIQIPPFSTTNDPYMVENVTIYAPDDMLNWTYIIPKFEPYAPINEPYTNGQWDHSGNGLNISLLINGKTMYNANLTDYLALYKPNDPFANNPFGYAYHASIEFFLSSSDKIVTYNNTIYVYIEPSQLSSAQIKLVYNDSDYAVQYLFGPVNRNYVENTTGIDVYTPELYMPSIEPISASFFKGQLIDYDYGYNYVIPENDSDIVYLMHVSGDSELVMGVTPTHANATLSIYYPNTPTGSLETTIGTIQGVYVKFANGTMERIYLSNTNITKLFTGVTMPQMSPMPPFWNYSFEISIVGLENILDITPTQALTVLNNSYVIVSYYDMASNTTVTNMTKLVSTPAILNVTAGFDHSFYYAPATPYEDIAVPGDQIFYLVSVDNKLPVYITLTDTSLGATSPTTVISVNTTSIYLTYTNESGMLTTVAVPNIVLTETAPASGIFKGMLYITLTNANGQLLPTGTPLNTTYLDVNGKVIAPVFDIINTTHEMMYINVTFDGVSAYTYYTLTQIPNVIENVTPIVYNPVDGELSTTVKSMISGYYYSGYIVLTISQTPTSPKYSYTEYFNLSATAPSFVVAFDLLPLSSLLNGHTYIVTLQAIVVPLSYEPEHPIGSVGLVFNGTFYFEE